MPKPDDVGVGVSIVALDPVNHYGEILMGVRKGAHRAGTLALPGGWMDRADSSVQETAIRELWEETGLTCNFPDTIKTHFISTEDHENFRSVTIFVLAHVYSLGPVLVGKEPHKCEQWQWVSENVLTELAVNKPEFLFPNVYQALSAILGWEKI